MGTFVGFYRGFSSNETIVSAAQSPPHQQARVPGAYGDPLGTRDPVAPPQEGPQAADDQDRLEARRLLTESERFRRSARLARAAELRHCLKTGRRRRVGSLEMIWMDNSAGQPRMGLIVPRFNLSAVARNRLRRRLREVWRRDLQARQPAWDLLIKARREAYQASFDQLRTWVLRWADAVLPRQ